MGLRINDTIPNLSVTTDTGDISLHDFVGDSWAVIFSHPKDFTPVCTTELGTVAKYKSGIPKLPDWTKKIPEIGWVFEVADMFLAGGKAKSSPKPTIFEASSHFKSKDSKVTFETKYGGNFFRTPGSKKEGNAEYIPEYDNPLGIMTFLHNPVVEVDNQGFTHTYRLFNAAYAVNHKAGIRLKDIRAALFFDACSETQVEGRVAFTNHQKHTPKQIVKVLKKDEI